MWTYMFANARINRGTIEQLETQTRSIKTSIIDQDRGSDALRMDLCRMMLVVEALKNVLIEKGYLTEDEFEQTVLHLDLEDGVRDGVRTQTKVPRMKCSNCGRLNRKRATCYSCGQPLHVDEYVPQTKKSCPKCKQINPPRKQKCMYCGEALIRRQKHSKSRR